MSKLQSTCLRVLFLWTIVSLNFAKACWCLESPHHIWIWYYRWPIAIIWVLFLVEALWFRFALSYKKNNIKLWKAIVSSIIFPLVSIALGWFLTIAFDMYDILSLVLLFLWFTTCYTIIIRNMFKISRLRALESSIACNSVFLLLILSTLF